MYTVVCIVSSCAAVEDEYITMKQLAMTRFQRNHRLMGELFNQTPVPDTRTGTSPHTHTHTPGHTHCMSLILQMEVFVICKCNNCVVTLLHMQYLIYKHQFQGP